MQGTKQKEVARMLGVTRHTICRWLGAHRHQGQDYMQLFSGVLAIQVFEKSQEFLGRIPLHTPAGHLSPMNRQGRQQAGGAMAGIGGSLPPGTARFQGEYGVGCVQGPGCWSFRPLPTPRRCPAGPGRDIGWPLAWPQTPGPGFYRPNIPPYGASSVRG